MTFFTCFVTVDGFIKNCTFLRFTKYDFLFQSKYRLYDDSMFFSVMTIDITFCCFLLLLLGIFNKYIHIVT